MRKPSRRFLGLTWLGWLNFLIVQWFFVRVAAELKNSPCGIYVLKSHVLKCRSEPVRSEDVPQHVKAVCLGTAHSRELVQRADTVFVLETIPVEGNPEIYRLGLIAAIPLTGWKFLPFWNDRVVQYSKKFITLWQSPL